MRVCARQELLRATFKLDDKATVEFVYYDVDCSTYVEINVEEMNEITAKVEPLPSDHSRRVNAMAWPAILHCCAAWGHVGMV